MIMRNILTYERECDYYELENRNSNVRNWNVLETYEDVRCELNRMYEKLKQRGM